MRKRGTEIYSYDVVDWRDGRMVDSKDWKSEHTMLN